MSCTLEKLGKFSKPKEKGDVGFRDLEAFNTAILAEYGSGFL